jgi:hypothetical protein
MSMSVGWPTPVLAGIAGIAGIDIPGIGAAGNVWTVIAGRVIAGAGMPWTTVDVMGMAWAGIEGTGIDGIDIVVSVGAGIGTELTGIEWGAVGVYPTG